MKQELFQTHLEGPLAYNQVDLDSFYAENLQANVSHILLTVSLPTTILVGRALIHNSLSFGSLGNLKTEIVLFSFEW